jgi:hypothetical protein
MGLFDRLFRGSARKLLNQMYSDTDVIQMAIYAKLFFLNEPQYGEDRTSTVAAAVSNKLFGRVSPMHSKDILELADGLANRLLESDHEIQYAALMSCRARLLCNADTETEEKWQMWDTIQWMDSVCNLPQDAAKPNLIRKLAITLHEKYLKKPEYLTK